MTPAPRPRAVSLVADGRRVERWRAKLPFSLRETVLSHGWFEVPPLRWDDDHRTLWAVLRTGRRGLLGACVRQVSARTLEVSWFLQSRVAAAREASLLMPASATLRAMLAVDRDLSDFHRLAGDYPPIRWTIERAAGRIVRGPDLFGDAVKTICAANTAWKQAVQCLRRLSALAPTWRTPSGFSVSAMPAARELLDAGAEWLRARARVGYRAGQILAAARLFDAGDFPDPDFARDDPDLLLKALMRIPGIGPAGARYLMGTRGRFERLSIDSAVVNFLAGRHFNGRKPAPREIEALYEAFGPWRALVYWMEFLPDYRRSLGLWDE